jgi:hypothetical protein
MQCIDDNRDTGDLIAEELIDRGLTVSTAYDGTICRKYSPFMLARSCPAGSFRARYG